MNIIKLQAPAFKNETEEADWWYDNRRIHDADLIASMENGEGPVVHYDLQQPQTFSLSLSDISLAKAQAERIGIPYEEHAARLFHEAVQAEEHRKAS